VVLEVLISLIFLVAMEVALGIDNVIFVSILAGKLPIDQQRKARRQWMIYGIILRVVLLVTISLLIQVLKAPLFPITIPALKYDHQFTGKHIILIAGGIFLLIKAVLEIHEKLESGGIEKKKQRASGTRGFRAVMLQIVIIDLVFSIDSIVTAIGMIDPEDANGIYVMSSAVIIAMVGMFAFAKPIGEFVFKHPTFKMLALSFLLLIGISLVAEGLGQHISKGYVYFAMVFSMLVELMNMRIRAKSENIELNMSNPESVLE
jgi:predicted tellurium resistance membrane protein TerC